MLVYRFKITLDDHDEFYRELEVGSEQSFEDFHLAMVDGLGLDKSQLASFFFCDYRWRRGKEIALMDMNDEVQEEDRIMIMREHTLADLIDDPHQKFMYVYDYLKYHTFLLELLKILPADSKATYPRIIKSSGDLPREFTAQSIPIGEPDFDEEAADLDFLNEDVGYDEEDMEDFFPDDATGPMEDFDEEKF